MTYIEEVMPTETPVAFGLHPNAEIGFKLREAELFCKSVMLLQPRGEGVASSVDSEQKVCDIQFIDIQFIGVCP